MRDCLEEMSDLVKNNVEKAQQRKKAACDRGTKPRSLEVGDLLALLPMQHNQLKLEWVGPYRVTWRVTSVDCEVETLGRYRGKKVYNINLLKRWYSAQPETRTVCLDPQSLPTRGVLGGQQPSNRND